MSIISIQKWQIPFWTFSALYSSQLIFFPLFGRFRKHTGSVFACSNLPNKNYQSSENSKTRCRMLRLNHIKYYKSVPISDILEEGIYTPILKEPPCILVHFTKKSFGSFTERNVDSWLFSKNSQFTLSFYYLFSICFSFNYNKCLKFCTLDVRHC